MEEIKYIISVIARIMEAVGVAIIAIGGAFAIITFLVSQIGDGTKMTYSRLRQQLGKAILLGLEVLVAADIIATVVTEPTLQKVLILGIIVLIRTFLSLSLQVEVEGKFPWQSKPSNKPQKIKTQEFE